jgi:hypothetical protein
MKLVPIIAHPTHTRMVQLDKKAPVLQLRVAVQIRAILHHPGWHAGLL